MSDTIEEMQNLELLYFLAPVIMGSVIAYESRGNGIPSLSHAALGKKASKYVLFWGLSLAAIVFAKLMYGWFIPHFDLGQGFKTLVAVLLISQVLTAIFPVEGKNVDKLHAIFGSMLAICMVIFVGILVDKSSVSNLVRITDAFLLVVMIISAITPRWTKHLSPNNFFAHELVFFGLWHSAVLLTVYAG